MTVNAKRICWTIAAVLLFIAYLIAGGAIDTHSPWWSPQALAYLGLGVGFVGFAL